MSDAPLERLIGERYPSPEWATVYELRQGTGYGKGREGRIDAASFNCWPSKGDHRIAFECKRTRADFSREIENPAKRKWVEEQFHQTFFVCSHGIVDKSEVPDGWGLLVATKDGGKLIQRKIARHRESSPMGQALALSTIRSLSEQLGRSIERVYQINGDDVSPDQLRKIVEEKTMREREVLHKARDVAAEQAFKAKDAASKLSGPLRVLLEHTGRSRFTASREATSVTEADVHRLVKEIRLSVVRQFRNQFSAIGISMDSVIRELDALDAKEAADEQA